jgi:sugar/nucleoside kinase (ribokinase family)
VNVSLNFRFVLLFVITSFTIATSAQSIDPPQPIIATYEGQVYSGDKMAAILTTFTIQVGKQLAGTYVIEAEDGFESGILSECRLEGTYTVSCTWQDKHGTGFARILFSADYRSFNGYWGESSDTTLFPWNGQRSERGEE